MPGDLSSLWQLPSTCCRRAAGAQTSPKMEMQKKVFKSFLLHFDQPKMGRWREAL